MSSELQLQRYLLGGIGLLGLLIVGGLVWAIMSPISPQNDGANESGLTFTDTNDPSFGPADAKVVVRAFGDFQCPACAAAEPAFQYARRTYGDRVRFVWNDFPLTTIHPNAMVSSIAARCAEDQGKFWEYHDMLYQQQAAWSGESNPKTILTSYAKTLGLDEGSFTTCLNKETPRGKVTDDMSEGNRNRVDSTPTFFVDNRRIVGVLQNADWDREILAKLTAATSTTP